MSCYLNRMQGTATIQQDHGEYWAVSGADKVSDVQEVVVVVVVVVVCLSTGEQEQYNT